MESVNFTLSCDNCVQKKCTERILKLTKLSISSADNHSEILPNQPDVLVNIINILFLDCGHA